MLVKGVTGVFKIGLCQRFAFQCFYMKINILCICAYSFYLYFSLIVLKTLSLAPETMDCKANFLLSFMIHELPSVGWSTVWKLISKWQLVFESGIVVSVYICCLYIYINANSLYMVTIFFLFYFHLSNSIIVEPSSLSSLFHRCHFHYL